MANIDDDGKEEEKYDADEKQETIMQTPLHGSSDVPSHRQASARKERERKYNTLAQYDNHKYDHFKAEDYQASPIKWIDLKWDKSIKKREDCDTKHMLYLLWLAMEKTRDRQEMRNQTFSNYGRQDRVMVIPDFVQMMTDFIDWHIQDFDNNLFDGPFLRDNQRIPVIDKIKEVGKTKEGWGIKLYKYLTKDVQIPSESKVKIPNYTHTAIGLALDALSLDQMIELLQKPDIGVFATCKAKANKKKANSWKLEGYQEEVIKFMREEKMDGAAFSKKKRMEFTNGVKAFLSKDGDEAKKKAIKKVTAGITNLYAGIASADLNKIMK